MTRAYGFCIAACVLSVLLTGCAVKDNGKAEVKTKAPAPPKFQPADVVVLKDGSWLMGEIQRLTAGKLTLKTDYAGVLTLEMAKVAGITTPRTLNVRIKDSDRVLGALRYDAKGGQQVESKEVPTRKVAVDKVDAIWGVGEESPEVIALKQKLVTERPKWSSRFEAGIIGETGNTEKVSSRGRIEVHRKTPNDRSVLYFQAKHSRENGEDSEKEFLGGGKLEVDVSKRLFMWGRAEFENDEFEDVKLRSTATGGLGYFMIREKGQEWKFRAGAGFRHESFWSGGSEGEVIGELAEDYMKEVSEWLLFTHNITYNPSFEEVRDYRLTMTNAAEIPLTKKKDWKIRLGMENRYTAVPSPTVDRRMETTYFANLVWEFK